MRQIARALAVTLVAAIVGVTGWMLVFIQFAVVPDGTPYPDAWMSLTSGEQVEWLRTHTVVLRGFEGSVYMLQHFPQYSGQFAAMFIMTWVAAAVAVGVWWHLTRTAFKDTQDDATGLDRFKPPAFPGKEQ